MTDAAITDEQATKKSSKMPVIIGFVLALVGGAGGYYATSTGLLLAPESEETTAESKVEKNTFSDVVFIPMDPISVSLPISSAYKHLRFRAELEVKKAYEKDVETILPRIVDVMNTYLRAIEVSDLEKPSSLTRLRSQMLRRAQIVAGPERVNDLLVMEFVLN